MTSIMTYNSLTADILDYLDRSNSALVAQVPNFITLGEMRCSRECKNLGLKTSVTSIMVPGAYVYTKPARWLEVISINFGTATVYNAVSRVSVAGTKTLTLSAPHNLVVGGTVVVQNVGNAAYNGTWIVTAVTQLTVTYVAGTDTETLTNDTAAVVSKPLEQRTPLLPRSLEFCNDYWPDRTQTGTPRFYADYDFNNWLIVPTPTIALPYEVVFFQRPAPLSSTNQQNWFTQYARDLLLYACLLEATSYLKNDSRIPTWKDYYSQSVSAIKTENSQRVNDGSMMRQEAQ